MILDSSHRNGTWWTILPLTSTASHGRSLQLSGFVVFQMVSRAQRDRRSPVHGCRGLRLRSDLLLHDLDDLVFHRLHRLIETRKITNRVFGSIGDNAVFIGDVHALDGL